MNESADTRDADAAVVRVVLLRGVNVNGITVTSAALRQSMLSIDGVSAAKPLLASGNVTVMTVLDASQLKDAVETALRRDFGYEAWVVVTSPELLAEVAAHLPWADDTEHHVYLTFGTAEALDAICVEAERLATPWQRCAPSVLAWRVSKGTSTTDPLAKALARPRLKAQVTTRNLRTVTKLAVARPQ